MNIPITNRNDAGKALAMQLIELDRRDNLLVLALPRGGVPVAYEIAVALDAELDVLIVRKLGMPMRPEVAMGAIASGGVQFINKELIAYNQINPTAIDNVLREETAELIRRERVYRGSRNDPLIKGRAVVLVDDGLATGASMRVAIDAVKQRGAERIVVAVPVGPLHTLEQLQQLVDGVVCLATPEPFLAVSKWYRDFPQVSDDEVKTLLAKAWARGVKRAI
jgi:putative phosphoribosyl transferase